MTTYTLIGTDGAALETGLTAGEAAQAILWHDSHDYEIRREDDCWQLYVSRGSSASSGGNGGLTMAYANRRLIASFAADEAAAWEDVAKQVIQAGWDRGPTVMTDEAYAEMMAELAGDADGTSYGEW